MGRYQKGHREDQRERDRSGVADKNRGSDKLRSGNLLWGMGIMRGKRFFLRLAGVLPVPACGAGYFTGSGFVDYALMRKDGGVPEAAAKIVTPGLAAAEDRAGDFPAWSFWYML